MEIVAVSFISMSLRSSVKEERTVLIERSTVDGILMEKSPFTFAIV